jgi:hypothetical protein
MIHPYYTPKFIQFQAILAKMAIFVDYDDFYVNIFMSTFEPGPYFLLSFSIIRAIYWVQVTPGTLNIDFAIFLATCILRVNFIYLCSECTNF